MHAGIEQLEQLTAAAEHPAQTVAAEISHTGKKAIGCFPPRVPEELVYAAGCLPIGLWGGRTDLIWADRYLQGFCCSVLRANMELALRGVYNMLDGVLIPTLCDSLKCVAEDWKYAVTNIPVIPVVYPQNRFVPEGTTYLQAELRRVKNELEELTGQIITDEAVSAAFQVYEDYRAAVRRFDQVAAKRAQTVPPSKRHLVYKAAQFMDKREYTARLIHLNDALESLPKEDAGLGVILTGIMAEPQELLYILEENHITVVGDDLAQESRLVRTFARREGNVWERLAGRIVDQRGDTFFLEPGKSKGNLLCKLVEERQAKAVIVLMMKFCDPEEFDYPIYKRDLEAAKIPLLYLDSDQQMGSFGQLRTRIQGFAEMLR